MCTYGSIVDRALNGRCPIRHVQQKFSRTSLSRFQPSKFPRKGVSQLTKRGECQSANDYTAGCIRGHTKRALPGLVSRRYTKTNTHKFFVMMGTIRLLHWSHQSGKITCVKEQNIITCINPPCRRKMDWLL